MFNRGAFNTSGFNQGIDEFGVESQDTLNTTTQDESTSNNQITSSDEILLTVADSATSEISKVSLENVYISFSESIEIYRETSGLDPPLITLVENVVVENNSSILDTNEVVLIENSLLDNSIKTGDSLSLIVDETPNQNVNNISTESLVTSLTESIVRDKELNVLDNINTTSSESSQLINSVEVFELYSIELLDSKILNKEITTEDSLIVTIDKGTDYNTENYSIENLNLIIEDTSILDKVEDRTENINITLEETAKLEVYQQSLEDINITYDFISPLGFNQQGFNQTQKFNIESTEFSKLNIEVQDTLVYNISDSSELVANNYVSNSLNILINEQYTQQQMELNSFDSLEAILEGYNSLSKPINVNDNVNLNLNMNDSSQLAVSKESNDTIELDLTTSKRVTSELMLVDNGEFKKVTKGYVLVSGEWKTIIGYRGVVSGEWKNLKR